MNNGYHVHEVNPYYTQAVSEHRELHTAIERIHRILDETREVDASTARIAELTEFVSALRDRLARHFEQEENGGYLEEAIVRVPQIAPQAAILQRQHGEFLAAADEMLDHARAADAAPLVWANLKADYALFAKRLNAHEAAENSLLSRAFNEDSGLDV
ncbi:MAG: hemerythrin domain-containing protein [Planctomycetia bacterium]|nr:hemerythrin domain-containing protein [Planctomycetia bacterium]